MTQTIVVPQPEAVTAAPVAPVTGAPLAEVKKEEPLAPKYALLAKQQKQLREEQKRLQDDKKSWEAERQRLIDPSKFKTNALEVLAQHGVDYNALTQQALTQTDPTLKQIAALQKEIEDLKGFKDSQIKQSEGLQAREVEQARKQIIYEAEKLSSAPEYEVLKAFGKEGFDMVADKIVSHYNEAGTLLEVEEALKEVNAELTEELKKFSSLSVFKPATEPAPKEEPKQVATKPQIQAQPKIQPKTLTNQMTVTTRPTKSAQERWDRALLIAKGQRPT